MHFFFFFFPGCLAINELPQTSRGAKASVITMVAKATILISTQFLCKVVYQTNPVSAFKKQNKNAVFSAESKPTRGHHSEQICVVASKGIIHVNLGDRSLRLIFLCRLLGIL